MYQSIHVIIGYDCTTLYGQSGKTERIGLNYVVYAQGDQMS
jgi:hypothetical protein